MDLLSNIAMGIDLVFNIQILLLVLLGSVIGTLVGALPGLGPSAGVALLLPVTLNLPPSAALVFLCSIYLGTMYGGRITSILINTPGDAPAIVTAWDGYPMMKKGQGGIAMGISAISSFIGGLISLIILAVAAPFVAQWALSFSAPEYFAMMIFGFATIASLSDKNYLKSIMMVLMGFMVAMIGMDFISGFGRYTFTDHLLEGVDFVAVIIGLYGIGEVLYNVETSFKLNLKKESVELKNLFPKWKDIKGTTGSILRGTGLGAFIGMLPGAGGTMATFLSYSLEKNISKEPEEFGKGKIQGVAAPEAANNASVGGALIPMLALGIPGGGATAVLIGALIIFGLQPGPRIFDTSSDVVWTIIIGLFVANILLLLANIFLIPLFVKLIYFGQWYLGPIITFICVVGAFSLTYNNFNVWVALVFGILGYFFKKLEYPTAPFILSLVLAPLAEDSFRQSLILSRGELSIFFTRPISLTLMVLAILFLVYPIIKKTLLNKGEAPNIKA
ncbi:tripartite tricarboxylate transporter permease [Bacillus sp. ISL-47]|uniref:tripartite tricarboxylate transporter permease n=1 Tax=Bacillus sp. ISL-47 TaxID=2819130 RepID=UPI001BE8ECE0|nr:tripartite tricarboxylate transporter permease [Bacillus sp. ISL-47]MBT2689251.1 tripartite tricarboxylate transporter permease [Bacillus sp. ISL-47]MBT2708624.1 tripartite tricarboxylate transporter permease [Pseudomonas sp. ISL-84]